MAVQIRADEISEIIRSQIQGFDRELNVAETGVILSVGDGIARVYGLEKAMAGELLEFPHGVYGMVLNLEQDNVGSVLFGEDTLIKEGDSVKRTRRIASVPVGEAMAGRVVVLAARRAWPFFTSRSSAPSRFAALIPPSSRTGYQ